MTSLHAILPHALTDNPDALTHAPVNHIPVTHVPLAHTPLTHIPLAHIPQGAINFALFTSSAHSVNLCLFTEADLLAGRVTHEVPLDPTVNRTGDVWHVMLPGVRDDMLYGRCSAEAVRTRAVVWQLGAFAEGTICRERVGGVRGIAAVSGRLQTAGW